MSERSILPDSSGWTMDYAHASREEKAELAKSLGVAYVQDFLYEEYRKNFFRFCGEVVQIRTPDEGSIPFILRTDQQEAALVLAGSRKLVVLKARQLGYSTLFCAYVLWRATFEPGYQGFLLSKNETLAKTVLMTNKIEWALNRIPPWLAKKAFGEGKMPVDSRTEKRLPNDSAILVGPSQSDAARSETNNFVLMDEADSFPDAAEAYAALEPTTDIGGQLVILSTAKVPNGWYHKTYRDAKAGRMPDMVALFTPWHAVPGRDEAWYERKKAELEDWQLAQEYPATDEEPWVKTGANVFNPDTVTAIEAVDPLFTCTIKEDESGLPVIASYEHYVSIWEPPALDGRYAMGVDVSDGVAGGDFSSAHVLRILDDGSYRVVATLHIHIAAENLWEYVAPLGRYFNEALLAVERNNMGLVVLNSLVDYRNLYMMQPTDRSLPQSMESRRVGFMTNARTKPILLKDLASILAKGQLIVNDEATKAELGAYLRRTKKTPQGQESVWYEGKPHDDRVMSLGIALQAAMTIEPLPKHDETPVAASREDLENAGMFVGSLHYGRRGHSTMRIYGT